MPPAVRIRRALLVPILASLLSCSGRQVTPLHPVLLVGVDGMEWSVLLPLVAKGETPVLAGLMKRGRWGTLESLHPTWSPVIWTSIATGKVPSRHGITNFVRETPSARGGAPEPRVFTSGDRTTKAFWNILSDAGRSVCCVGWWITYPAEPIHGVMVSQTNTTARLKEARGKAIWKGSLIKGVPGQVYPPARQDEMLGILEDVERNLPRITETAFGKFPHPIDPFGKLMWDESLWAFRADATYARITLKLLESHEPCDLIAVYLGTPDVVSHRFWRYAYPDRYTHPPSREELENFGRVIEDSYRAADRAIGEFLAARRLDDTDVLVVSDHGFHEINTDHVFSADDPPPQALSGNHFDSPPGIFIAAGPDIAGPESAVALDRVTLAGIERIGSVLDITPTLLVLLGIPVGADMDGSPLERIIAPEALRRHPITRVPTHDTPQWVNGRRALQVEAEDQAERLEQLRALGYIK